MQTLLLIFRAHIRQKHALKFQGVAESLALKRGKEKPGLVQSELDRYR